jgi:hypothetical protein
VEELGGLIVGLSLVESGGVFQVDSFRLRVFRGRVQIQGLAEQNIQLLNRRLVSGKDGQERQN